VRLFVGEKRGKGTRLIGGEKTLKQDGNQSSYHLVLLVGIRRSVENSQCQLEEREKKIGYRGRAQIQNNKVVGRQVEETEKIGRLYVTIHQGGKKEERRGCWLTTKSQGH